MDAIKSLTEDHKTVRKLLEELVVMASRARKKREESVDQIRVQHKAHAIVEEEIFCSAFKREEEKRRREDMF